MVKSLDGEEWKVIPGLDGKYWISDKCRVFRSAFKSKDGRLFDEKILKLVNYFGIWYARSSKELLPNGKTRTIMINVAKECLKAFVSEPPNTGEKYHVVFIDNNPDNLKLENLKWVTGSLGRAKNRPGRPRKSSIKYVERELIEGELIPVIYKNRKCISCKKYPCMEGQVNQTLHSNFASFGCIQYKE